MNSTLRLCLALTAVAGLGGCAVYPAPGYGPYETGGAVYNEPYAVQTAPIYINGGVTYQRGYYRNYSPPVYHGGRGYGGRGNRDIDGDGIRNRNDRDRDGDGIRNRRDARPGNPNR